MLQIVLASQSPRRRDLLERSGFDHRVQSVKVSEIIEQNLNPVKLASHLATQKAEACLNEHKLLNQKGFLILGADTLVALNGKNLGKPESEAEAFEFLDLLSGKIHQVVTAFCLIETESGRKIVSHDETLVEFRKLSEQEIREYIATGEPMDKAGAYAIQGLGNKLVKEFKGSWSNVVGLPMEKLERVLKEEGLNVRRRQS
jgi:septum formation protein